MTTFLRPIWRSGAAVLALLVLLLSSGCDEGELLPPDPAAGDMFDRYVAIGNSITAGFQSGGINVNSQLEAYPVLLAKQMGLEVGNLTEEGFEQGKTFTVPALQLPGCPPPLTAIFPERQVLGGSDVECALRSQPVPTVLNNVAVPGAEVIDVLDNQNAASNANALTTFILGGRTQAEAAAAVQPTFFSAWIGNNDALAAALAGNPAAATPVSAFQERYTAMLDEMMGLPTVQGGVLVGVVDVTLIPNLSPGAAYAQIVPLAQQQGLLPPNLEIANNCAPAQSGGVLIPFQYGITFVQIAQSLAQQNPQNPPTVTLSCENNAPLGQIFDPAVVPDDLEAVSILTIPEIGTIRTTVQAYNSFIEQAASDRGLAFFNPNPTFQSFDEQGLIPDFPELFEIPQTPWGPDQPFGPLFSLDGVHPSAQTHRVAADALIAAINAKYGTNIPALEAGQ